MSVQSSADEGDDADLAALLAAAGPQVQPAAAAAAEVRAAVEAEWKSAVASRRTRRRFTIWTAAAGIAAAAVVVAIVRPWDVPPPGATARVVRVVGEVEADAGRGRWTRVADGTGITSGTRLRTGVGGRAALALEGLALRLDTHTMLALEDPERATLSQGAVYLDVAPGGGAVSPHFDLETPAGTVQHVGTQYEARVTGDAVRVGVREGRVRLERLAGDLVAEAGERLIIADGRIEREPLAPTASDWNWVAVVTPPFSIEGRSVDEFLAWAGRESGRQVVYATLQAEEQARRVMLRGTVEGLTPDEAVTGVLATTTLDAVVEPGRIRVMAAGR